MFAVLYLPQFPLQAALRHEPELWTGPVALVDPARTPSLVCGLTDPARQRGVSEGLTPTQAMARCGDVAIRHRSSAQEAAAHQAILQCAWGFSPHIEATAPGVFTLDLRGLACLSGNDPEGMVSWAAQVRAALECQHLRARIGVGPTPNLSRHAARWGAGIEIVSDAAAFIGSLPVAALEPSSDVAAVLQNWGIRNVGELLALRPEEVVDRLGLEALALFAAASIHVTRPLNLARPPECFDEAYEFEDAVETMEPLLFILRRFVDPLSHRLALSGLAAERLILRLRLDSGEVLERRLAIPRPTRVADILFRVLHTHLETLRTDSPVKALALTADPCRPEQKQLGLFEAALRDPQQFQETLARLTAWLGPERVGNPVRENTHRPDAFRMLPPDFENAPESSGPNPDSLPVPIRRFRPSVPAEVRTCGEDNAPVYLKCTVAQGKLKRVVGPWLVSGDWWQPCAWEREEWDAVAGEKVLRLVRKPDGWFVEGILD